MGKSWMDSRLTMRSGLCLSFETVQGKVTLTNPTDTAARCGGTFPRP